MSCKKLSKILIFFSIVWLLISSISYFLKLIPYMQLELCANAIELVAGFAAAILSFTYAYKSKQLLPLGIGLAVLSWTFGEAFWLSYAVINGNVLPYPSVGEFGFLGTYFFIAGSIGDFKSNNKRRIVISILALVIMLLPIFFVFKSSNTLGAVIYNFVFITMIAFVLYRSLSKYTVDFKYLFIGIVFFCLTDIVFIIEANIRDYSIICDMLYPLSLSVLAYGGMEEGVNND